MRRIEGTVGVKLIECVNSVKGKWRIRWDVQENEDRSANYMEEEFVSKKPSEDEIKATVLNWYNSQIDTNIISGFQYEGNIVWLSSENQFNYKAAYDLAVQTKGKNLPVVFKFGTDESPFYREFKTLTDLSDFYMKVVQHIQNALSDGWRNKDLFNIEDYKV